MNYFKNFIESIVSIFSRDTVVDQARIVLGIMREHLIPSMKRTAELEPKQVASSFFESFAKKFKTYTGENGHPLKIISAALPNIYKNLEFVADVMENSTEEEIAARGMNFKKANLVKFVAIADFFARYTEKLEMFIINESILEPMRKVGNDLSSSGEEWAPYEIAYINDNLVNFFAAFQSLSVGHEKLKKQFDDLPDIVVVEADERALGMMSARTNVDPLRMGFVNIPNPFLAIGKRRAELQHARYEESKETMRYLMLRRLQLEKSSQGKQDAKLERDLAQLRNRIDALAQKIADYERDLV